MSEMRQDPTTKEWVILAKERAKRHSDFVQEQANSEPPSYSPSCPFCPGNEAMTPSEVLLYQDEETPNWRIRVFANRFPALKPEGSTRHKKNNGLFLSMNGVGAHEVLVETPLHNQSLAIMKNSEVFYVLRAYRERYNVLSQMPFAKQVIIFKNNGVSAGTSLEHPHSQLVATPVVPKSLQTQCEIATQYYDNNGSCLYSDITTQELTIGKRIVMETDGFVVFHPFASHQPCETWIVPRAHQASFGNTTTEELKELANVLRITLLKLYRGLNNPDFNYVIDTAPVGDEDKNYYLWHMRIIPRLTERAGFEVGSGIYINTAIPEETARFMREFKIE